MKKLTKILSAALAVCVAGGSALALGACSKNSSKYSSASKLSVKEFYGMGAVTTVKLLEGESSSKSAYANVEEITPIEDLNGVKEETQNFNKYFNALNSFLSDDPVSITSASNTDEAYAAYSVKLTVNGKDIAGNSTNYVLYYNETLVNEKYEQDDDEDETESSYVLEGVMVVDGATYNIRGERELEVEGNETEEELKIRAYTDKDSNSYVEMKQEISEEDGEREVEYVYSIYQNGRLTERTSMEFEREEKGGKVETEYEIKFLSGSSKGRYKIKREEKPGETTIKVTCDMNGGRSYFYVKEITVNGETAYEYTFSDQSVVTYFD